MKKHKNIILAILACLLLAGCAVNGEKPEETTEIPDDTSAVQIYETEPVAWGADYFVSETRAIFDFKIKDNPIDKEYNTSEVPSTTKEIVQRELDYANIWLMELNASCYDFVQLLSDEDRAYFEANQAAWESVVKEDRELLGDIFGEGKYSVHMGSVFRIEVAANNRKAVRERTLYVKYLQYSFESNSEGVSGDVSVLFHY